MPRISVVVPVRNEAAHIERTLDGLLNQDLPPEDYEIIVVDGVSDDKTVALVRARQATAPHLTVLNNPQRLASAARNIGIRHAKGDYVLIVDGHCALTDPHHLAAVLEAFATSGADCLGRPQPLQSHTPTAFQRCVAAARMSWLGHNPHSAIFSDHPRFVPADNVAVAYRRDLFDVVGYFDESFDACEDVDFNTRVRRMGFSCFFTPTITVAYQPRASLSALAYQMIRYGRGRARLGRKYLTTISLPSLVPPLWMLWLLGGAVVALCWSAFAVFYAVSVGSYVLVLALESLRLARTKHVSVHRLPVILAAIHMGFAWGYWHEMWAGLRTALLGRRFAVVGNRQPS